MDQVIFMYLPPLCSIRLLSIAALRWSALTKASCNNLLSTSFKCDANILYHCGSCT